MIEASSPGAGVRKIAFDYLVVATGMHPSYFGHDEFARYAPGLKNISDAETIRAKILGAFELAATTEDEGERARQMTFILVGAGPTGVELAGSLAHLVKVTLRGNFRRIDPGELVVIALNLGGILWNHRELKLLIGVVQLGARVQFSLGCLELASRKPSWPAFMCERENRPDIWTQAI
jgi:NADH dehydrogenase FAD-containing subunit